ncbi:MAG: prepilin peptidase [Myxococcales bacterium]|nr:prepilin peptidase [Myxococcales bacterium]MDP3499545.1 prepilin peptidase [Myxococcales bacterium]
MPAPELVLWPLIGLAVIVAAVVDLKKGAVPAWVAWPTLVVALAARVVLEGVGSVDQGLVSGLLGALGCAAPFALLALSGPRVGWNDVKLLLAVGAGLGVPRALSAVFLISVVGAVAAVFFVLLRRRRSASVSATEPKPLAAVDSARSIPYGVPIAIGALWAMAWVGPTVSEGDEMPGAHLELVDGGVTAEEFQQPAFE